MTAQTEGIEFPEDYDWDEPGIVRDAIEYQLRHVERGIEIGRRQGVEVGRREGIAEGIAQGVAKGVAQGRRALLAVAAGCVDGADLARLERIESLEELAAAVQELLRR